MCFCFNSICTFSSINMLFYFHGPSHFKFFLGTEEKMLLLFFYITIFKKEKEKCSCEVKILNFKV